MLASAAAESPLGYHPDDIGSLTYETVIRLGDNGSRTV